MGAYGAVLVLLFTGWTFLETGMVWGYLAVVVAFELWLASRIAATGNAPVIPGEPPYAFTEDEATLVRRYRFYFTWPAAARQSCSVLAAAGLTALLLAPWLTYKGAFAAAVLVGLNIFLVAWFTRRLAPVMVLQIRAHKGERDALRLLEAHDPAWQKSRAVLRQSPDPH